MRTLSRVGAMLLLAVFGGAPSAAAGETLPSFEALLAHPVSLRPELRGVHPRVFVTKQGLESLRARARTTHREQWQAVLLALPAMKGTPPPPPGPQQRRSQNNVAFAIAGVSLAWQIEQKPEYLKAAKEWTLAAIDYEPWGYTYNKPNVDLAAGHLLYAIGWAYDLLYDELLPGERDRVRASLERHAGLVYDYFAPGPKKRFNFTQNHDFIPTSGLAVAALALFGESKDAPRWAALARAHHHRAASLLSPDGYYYEGVEYWVFSAPWLVHFLDAWEHATGESLWGRELFRNWKHYLAHSLLPDGQSVFDFGDIWEGALTRAKAGAEYGRIYPGGRLESNFNALYRVAARLRDPEAQAVAARYASFGHGNLEEYWTLLWRDPELQASPMSALPLRRHFEDSGVVFVRSSWEKDATAFAFKAGPPEGHRVASRDVQKVYATDQYSVIAIAGAAGPAIEMARLMRIELEHYEKIEGLELDLEGKANKLGQMIRQNLPMAMQGLVVVPIFTGYDLKRNQGRIYKYDVTGGAYEEIDYYAVGSGGKDARSSLKKTYRPQATKDEVLRMVMEALFDAADEDRGTGGVDLLRGIYPTIKDVTKDGITDVPVERIRAVYEEIVRDRNGGGAG